MHGFWPLTWLLQVWVREGVWWDDDRTCAGSYQDVTVSLSSHDFIHIYIYCYIYIYIIMIILYSILFKLFCIILHYIVLYYII